ncbi:translation initiation factor IF-2 [Sinanaerobacter sp. ZZT-01]|uniref:translation initiation factor IF-2 n=1 Tax=Sinanaerobacter sp. ZZT-01 TaxID=3111540 RepID=UPI002D790250|nr:translation initiation factor IF-2 [Sinanaerobacter sp. ZZT-01]WRR93227.1 translation initiation factor IF-2 [Sinanaerobacter sp. ZZT-01]
MSKRVYELAKELNLANKEMLEKIKSMGIKVKTHMSVIEDEDATAIKNTIAHGKKITDHAAEGAKASKKEGEAKVTTKPTSKLDNKTAEKPLQDKASVKEETTASTSKAAQDKSMAKTIIAPNGKTMLQGKPMPKNAVPQTIAVEEKMEEKVEAKREIKNEVKATAKEDVPVTAAQIMGRPEPQKFKIIKTSEQVTKEAEERAARVAKKKAQAEKLPQQSEKKPNETRRNDSYRDRDGQRSQQNRTNRSGNNQNSRYEKKDSEGNFARGNRSERTTDRSSDRNVNHTDKNNRPNQGNRSNQGNHSSKDRNTGKDRFSKPEVAGDVLVTKPSRNKKQNDKNDYKKESNKAPHHRTFKPLDLTKSTPKKHKKNKAEKVANQVEESNIEAEELPVGTKIITVPITVKGLSEQIEKSTSQIIMALMKLGIMANINQNIDEDTAILLGAELGVSIVVGKVDQEVVEEGLELFEDKKEDLKSRPPIITVMGHVDHGKTSLLDAIRKTSVTDREAGGITQHIGASEVVLNGNKIVLLDTPGHEAFTAMRARGANVTDIAILVVAADDSVKPQTIESISHAKAAGVPIIVAINKMDKPGANPEKVKQDLTEHGILVEDWGGDTICVPVSAKSGEGIVSLLEMVLLQAEVLELKANPNRLAMGTVIEARLDKSKGPVATLLVLNGTLKAGMSVVAGTCSGRIRAMTNFKGDTIAKAGPATAVEILGLTEVPEAGDEFNAVRQDKLAREIAENRRTKMREEVMARNSSVTLEQLFSQIEEGEIKELNLIIKADVQGSVGALTTSLEKLKNENVKVRIIHSGVGTVTESDIMLANTSNAIIIGFNVRPSTAVATFAEREGVEIRNYRIIYEVIDDIEAAMKGMLDPVFKEVVLGKIEVRDTFKVPGVGIIAGAYVLEGKVQRNAEIRLVRDGIIIHEGKISSLKRFKDDAKEVASGYECGIGIENFNDIKENDIIEAFKMEEIERK